MSRFDLPDLSAGLYEAALNPLLIPAALEDIAQSLGCDSYHQMVLDVESHQVTAGWTGVVVDDLVQAASENHYIRMDDRSQRDLPRFLDPQWREALHGWSELVRSKISGLGSHGSSKAAQSTGKVTSQFILSCDR